MIDESETSPVLDVMLVNRENDLAEVVIEITHTQGFKKDIQKVKELMEEYSCSRRLYLRLQIKNLSTCFIKKQCLKIVLRSIGV